VSVKDRTILALMASLEFCTDRMSGFMELDKPSCFYNYYVKPHIPASCGAFTFGGRMRPRAKTSSREQGPDFDIVGTCERLSYVRAPGVKRMVCWSGSSPVGCISIRVAATLSVMSDSLSLQSSRSRVVIFWIRGCWIRACWLWLCYQDYFVFCFTFDVDFCQYSACLCLF
jgi:hypothetical protein